VFVNEKERKGKRRWDGMSNNGVPFVGNKKRVHLLKWEVQALEARDRAKNKIRARCDRN
jgi:hypothetical protein